MTPNILENISTWLVDWSLVTIMGNMLPNGRGIARLNEP